MDFLTAILGGTLDHISVAIIGVSAIVITFVQTHQGKRLKRIEHKAGTAAEQTANSHDKNLRDEIDDNHREVMDYLRAQDQRMNNIDKRVNNIATFVRKGRTNVR